MLCVYTHIYTYMIYMYERSLYRDILMYLGY